MITTNKEFGPLLRHYRRMAGKTLGDVSTQVGKSLSYISDIEYGNRKPPQTPVIIAIANFLGVDHAGQQALMRTAAAARGAVEIRDPAKMELAAGLARTNLDRLSPDEWAALQRILLRDDTDEE